MGDAPCRSGCGRRGSRCATSARRAARPATPSATRGIRPARDNRRAARRARRSPPPRGTCRPAAGRRYPTAAGGSWWRRARRSAARAGRARSPAPRPFTCVRNASISARCGRRRRRRRSRPVGGGLDRDGRRPWRGVLGRRIRSPIRWPYPAARRNGQCGTATLAAPIPRGGRGPRAACSSAANHSARAAARRWPRASSGSLSASISAMTSARAVTCDEARTRAQRRLVELVEGGQAAREELAIDHPLGEPVDGSESRAGSPSSCSPSPTSRLLREPSIDSRLRTTIQSIRVPSISRRCRRASRTISA